jgi:hypothetical protein
LDLLDFSSDANDLQYYISSFIFFNLIHLFVAVFHHLLYDSIDLFAFSFAAPVFVLFKITVKLYFFSFKVIYFLAFNFSMCQGH